MEYTATAVRGLIGEILPLAIVVTVSPINIVAAILTGITTLADAISLLGALSSEVAEGIYETHEDRIEPSERGGKLMRRARCDHFAG